jgi:GNAT superfamily N-acetyltransferase
MLSFEFEPGVPALLRRLVPEDRARVEEAYRQLSPESRYLRFWTRFREINPRFVERLIHPGGGDHATWVIVLPDNDEVPGVGGGSFWRLDGDPLGAEVSFTVADAFQGRGAGTILLAALWLHAEQTGIRYFAGHALDSNLAMRAWWDALGAAATQTQRGWELRLELDRDGIPGSLQGRRLRHWFSVLEQGP